jgi:hypothetical protein
MRVAVQKAPTSPIVGVKTIVLDLVMSDRVLPILPLIDAGIYNHGVNEILPDLLKIDMQKSAEMAETVEAAYRQELGAETVRVANPFSQTVIPFDFYAKLPDAAKAKVCDLCASEGADLALGYTFRVITSGVGMFGMNGTSFGAAQFFLYDQNCVLVAQGVLQTEARTAAPKDVASYMAIFDDAMALVPSLFATMKR